MKNKKILILGSGSYVAQSIYPALKEKYNVTTLSHQELDLTNLSELKKILKNDNYDFVINCAVKGGRRIKQDSGQDCYENILSQENLLACNNLYKHLIIFGSGIEYDRTKDVFLEKEEIFRSVSTEYYGLSKYVNSRRAAQYNNIINLRIFAVFSELEHEHRFIKTNIKNYIDKKPITIFDNQFYDFFYMEDLITVIKHFIENPPEKYTEINCVYKEKLLLSCVARIINSLDNYEVPIIIEKMSNKGYSGDGSKMESLKLNFIGLNQGIKQVYEKLKYGK